MDKNKKGYRLITESGNIYHTDQIQQFENMSKVPAFTHTEEGYVNMNKVDCLLKVEYYKGEWVTSKEKCALLLIEASSIVSKQKIMEI